MHAYTSSQSATAQQQKLQQVTQQLHTTNANLQAVQRNYKALSTILHERLQLLQQTSQNLAAQQSESNALKAQLEAADARADSAEQQCQTRLHISEEMLQLSQEAEQLKASREESYQQCMLLQEQLAKIKQDLYATSTCKQSLAGQLEEQCSLTNLANSAVARLKLEAESANIEKRELAAQVQSIQQSLNESAAQVQQLGQQLADVTWRAHAAEDAVTAEVAVKAKLQQELTAAKGSHATHALKLLDMQSSQQQLEERISKAEQALAVEQAAKAEACKQVLQLQAQLVLMTQRAEAAEAATAAAAIQLSAAQQATADAKSAQYAAEEAFKAMEARSRLVDQRLAEAQQQAAKDKGVADATQRELRDHIADKDISLTQHLQQQHAWRFRQLELLTRVLGDMDGMAEKVKRFEQIAETLATTLVQQHDQHQQQLQELMMQVEQWQGYVEVMAGANSHMNSNIARLQQQMAAQKQRLLSSDKESQMLQKQLEHVSQQLSMSNLMERKLRADLADEHLARDKAQAEAQQEVQSALTALAAAEQAAGAALGEASAAATKIAQLENKLATADSDLVSIRLLLAARESESASTSSNLKAAARQLQQLAAGGSQIVGILQQAGAVKQHEAASLLAALAGLAVRPSTPARPASAAPGAAAGAAASMPDTVPKTTSTTSSSPAPDGQDVSAAGAAVLAQSWPDTQTRRTTESSPMAAETAVVVPRADDAGSSRQLLEGLTCLQQQILLLLSAVQHLMEQRISLEDSTEEVAAIAAKLLHTEESLASNYTCLVCMRIFDRPVTVVPCGHNYCKSCLVACGTCRECHNSSSPGGAAGPPAYVAAPALERLCAKYEYRLTTLKGLQRVVTQQQGTPGRL